jgi:hypothetical protein
MRRRPFAVGLLKIEKMVFHITCPMRNNGKELHEVLMGVNIGGGTNLILIDAIPLNPELREPPGVIVILVV